MPRHRFVAAFRFAVRALAPLLLLALALCPPAAADGPNLVSESGWVPYYPGQLQASAVDRRGDPRSGSLQLADTHSAGAGSRCLVVTPGESYAVGGWAWIDPSHHRAGDFAVIGVDHYADLACDPAQRVDVSVGPWLGQVTEPGRWQQLVRLVPLPAGARSARMYALVTQGDGPDHTLRAYFDDLFYRQATCEPSAEALCLSRGRFRVTALWKTRNGASGQGKAVPFSADAGSFWFFGAENLELDVKLLDACGLNSRFWFFAAGMTDVEVTITVTDTQSGASKSYTNPLGRTFRTVTDVEAFAGCP